MSTPQCPRCFEPLLTTADFEYPCTGCGFPNDRVMPSASIPDQLRAKSTDTTTQEKQFVTMMRACHKAGVSLNFMLTTIKDAMAGEVARKLPHIIVPKSATKTIKIRHKVKAKR